MFPALELKWDHINRRINESLAGCRTCLVVLWMTSEDRSEQCEAGWCSSRCLHSGWIRQRLVLCLSICLSLCCLLCGLCCDWFLDSSVSPLEGLTGYAHCCRRSSFVFGVTRWQRLALVSACAWLGLPQFSHLITRSAIRVQPFDNT